MNLDVATYFGWPEELHAPRGKSFWLKLGVTGCRITALETVIPDDIMSGLMLLRIHTDADTVGGEPVIGHGETYYLPEVYAFEKRTRGHNADLVHFYNWSYNDTRKANEMAAAPTAQFRSSNRTESPCYATPRGGRSR